MISATQARAKTEESIKGNTMAETIELSGAIERAVEAGSYYVSRTILRRVDLDKIADTFRGLGYDVIVNIPNDYIEINWYV